MKLCVQRTIKMAGTERALGLQPQQPKMMMTSRREGGGRSMADWVEDDNDDGRKLQPRSIQRKEKSKENNKKERNAKDVPSLKQSEQKLKPNRSE